MSKLTTLKHHLSNGTKRLRLSRDILGAAVMELFKLDPRAVNCQVTMMSLHFGLTTRIYSVKQLHDYVMDMESHTVEIDQVIAFGILSEELKKRSFCAKRSARADLSYPIIVDKNTGLVLDGRHRLAKAESLGLNTIQAYLVNADELPYLETSSFTKKSEFINI